MSDEHSKEDLQNATEVRRNQLFDLHFMRGLSLVACSEALNVHINTIYNDVKRIKEGCKDVVTASDIDELCGEVILNLQKAFKEAWLQYTIKTEAVEKQKYFELYLKAHKALYTFMLDVGLIKRAPSKQEIEYSSKKVQKMSNDELDDHLSSLLKGINICDSNTIQGGRFVGVN